MRYLSLLVVLLVPAPSLYAQSGSMSLDDLPIIHVTDELMQQPSALDAVAAYHAAGPHRAAPRALAQPPPDVGDVQEFEVINLETESYETIEFALRYVDERFYVWVETAQLDSLHEDDVEVLHRALGERTPLGSYDPDRGIIPNNEDVFGMPPNVDGDGRTDVLVLDIRDGWQPGEPFVAGFVNGADLCLDEQPNCVPRNERDILYLDARPGLYADGERRERERVASTAAHEYQHLIHLAHDAAEITFVNEGLSEWAEILNGYGQRAPSYLTDVDRYNVALLDWRRGITTETLDDYQRAGLFTNYIADRIGVMATGSITREPSDGDEGYRQVLERQEPALSLSELVVDFHTANLINDTTVAPRFGYTTDVRAEVEATPAPVFDGRDTTSTPVQHDTLAAGGVLYATWTDVQNFHLTFDVDPDSLPQQTALRERTHLRAVLAGDDGSVATQDVILQDERLTFDGTFDRIAIIAVHTAPGALEDTPVAYAASWTAVPTAVEEPVLVEQVKLDGNHPNPFREHTTVSYHLPRAADVEATVYDVLGRRVVTLVDGRQPAGRHTAQVDAGNWAAGVYVCRLTAGGHTITHAMMRVR